jgi:hypothetical protein
VVDDPIVRGKRFRPNDSDVSGSGSGTHDLRLPPAVPMNSRTSVPDNPVAP